ncbi:MULTISPECIES: hypothetical protein [Desulfosporosinus]|uniref:Uncharacterized protein n=1 Tax=Desulfosporosinus acididurans TaxID=476652 RepID=A0A0J1IIN0_9FIRM|nr:MULTISPECIES: hypothetical protein [Desulfosporosinus]KLU64591.1 hypothetical protein DEAC_c35380 [Desulfosporosinus acididurans]
MGTMIAGFTLNKLLMLGLGVIAVGFILKKLFKLAIAVLIIAALVYYGLPLIHTTISTIP